MKLLDILQDPRHRDYPFDKWVSGKDLATLEAEADALEQFRKTSDSLYDRVRALLFLSNLHQFHIVALSMGEALLPYAAVENIRNRHFEQAIADLLAARAAQGNSPALSSALAAAYRGLAFETLAKQVRRSVRSFAGNQWMFRVGHRLDYPLQLRRELLTAQPFPV